MISSVTIAAPVEAVERVLLDAELAPLWTTGLERLELVEGAVGEPGSVGLAHYVEGNRRYVLEDRLLSVEQGRRYESEVLGGGLKARVKTTLEAEGNETTMTIRWSGKGTNPITWVVLPLMKGRIARQSAKDLEMHSGTSLSPAGRPPPMPITVILSTPGGWSEHPSHPLITVGHLATRLGQPLGSLDTGEPPLTRGSLCPGWDSNPHEPTRLKGV